MIKFDVWQNGIYSGVEEKPLEFNPNPCSVGKEFFLLSTHRIFYVWDALMTSYDVRAGGACS